MPQTVCRSRAFSHFYKDVFCNDWSRTKGGIAGISDPSVTAAPLVFSEIISSHCQDMHRRPANYISQLRGACVRLIVFSQNTTKLILKLFLPPQMKILNSIIKWKPSNPFSHTGNKKYHPQEWRGNSNGTAMTWELQYIMPWALQQRNWLLLFTDNKGISLEDDACIDESH